MYTCAKTEFNVKWMFSVILGSIFKNFCRVDYVGDPTPQASTEVNRFKVVCLRMHEIVTLRRLFFIFFKV